MEYRERAECRIWIKKIAKTKEAENTQKIDKKKNIHDAG